VRRSTIRRELTRVDVAGGDTGGLPLPLLEAIEAEGGLWWASDYYTKPADVVARARDVGAVALRLDMRDLSLLEQLPAVRYLHLRSDGGRPPLAPIASLRHLRALILEVKALTGTVDLAAHPDLRWLRISLGGKGGAAMLPAMATGHQTLEWLAVAETRARTVAEVAAPFPGLRTLRVVNADHIRALGPLADAAPRLRRLEVSVVGLRTIAGIEGAPELETLALESSPLTDLEPLRALRRLRYVRLFAPRAESIESLRGHPAIRMLELILAGEPDRSVLDSMPGLVAIGRGRRFEAPAPWPDVYKLQHDDPLWQEWSRMRRGG
jgi:hypothetical protein